MTETGTTLLESGDIYNTRFKLDLTNQEKGQLWGVSKVVSRYPETVYVYRARCRIDQRAAAVD